MRVPPCQLQGEGWRHGRLPVAGWPGKGWDEARWLALPQMKVFGAHTILQTEVPHSTARHCPSSEVGERAVGEVRKLGHAGEVTSPLQLRGPGLEQGFEWLWQAVVVDSPYYVPGTALGTGDSG